MLLFSDSDCIQSDLRNASHAEYSAKMLTEIHFL